MLISGTAMYLIRINFSPCNVFGGSLAETHGKKRVNYDTT